MNPLLERLQQYLLSGQPIPIDLRLALLATPLARPVCTSTCAELRKGSADRHLFWGDNAQLLLHLQQPEWQARLEQAGGIKLIYIDPPYNVGLDFQNKAGEFAFTDKWSTDGAYLTFLAERLQLMYEVLAPNGCLYLQCDHRMTAPIRLLLDSIFDKKNFRNEIIWYFSNGGGRAQHYFNRKHNTIFLYSKGPNPVFNGKEAGVPRNTDESTFSGYFKTDENGRRYQEVRSNNKVYIYYLDEKKNADDVWTIPIISQRDTTERIDYPTQKPLALLERIILASSNRGDLIADFFCGSGTTLVAAEKLDRRWIGCDVGTLAINKTLTRFRQYFPDVAFGRWDIA